MSPYLPQVLVNMILEYDGRIKYEYTKGDYYNGKYVNIISKNDPRYNMLDKVVSKKKEIITSPISDELYFNMVIAFFMAHPFFLRPVNQEMSNGLTEITTIAIAIKSTCSLIHLTSPNK